MTIRDYFLQNCLPTTSDIERELWFRTNETAKQFVEIMKDYVEDVIDECAEQINEDEISHDIREDIIVQRIQKSITDIKYQL